MRDDTPTPRAPNPQDHLFFWCNDKQRLPRARKCKLDHIPAPKSSFGASAWLEFPIAQGKHVYLPACPLCNKPLKPICCVVVRCNECHTPIDVHFFEANNPFTREARIQAFTSRYVNSTLTSYDPKPCEACPATSVSVSIITTNLQGASSHIYSHRPNEPEPEKEEQPAL